jgi:hypothetical protein
MAGKDPLEKLTEHINAILDERDKRNELKADPKARNASLMARLEAFLDAHEASQAEGARKPRAVKDEPDEDKSWSLFG